MVPACIAAYPLLANDSAAGVLELCLFHPLTAIQTRWLEKASETMANVLRFAMESEERRQAEERTRLILELQRRGHLWRGHRRGDSFCEPGRLPDAGLHGGGTDRPAVAQPAPSPPAGLWRLPG